MKKLISIILIIATILNIGINLFFVPKTAKATIFGDIAEIMLFIKDWIVDALPKIISRVLMVRLEQEIARWAQGGFSDENKPFAMTSWKKELNDALNIAEARFIEEFDLTPLCSPIRISLNAMFGLGLRGAIPYSEYAACTVGNIVDNVEEFWKNPSIGVYGWDTWTALMQPQNNIFGATIMALQREEEIQDEEVAEKEKEIQAGQGYKNDAICTKEEGEECKANCAAQGPPSPECLADCEKRASLGVCLEKQTNKLGSEIKSSIDSAIGSEFDWLISADEITEMLALIFSGLFNKLIFGAGLSVGPTSSSSTSSSSIDKNQLQYSYYKSFKKTQTSEDIKKLKTDIVNNILNSIKRLTTSAYDCNKDKQLKGDVYQDVANEILDQESQHLYTAIEGVDLKPDFIVLDSSQAVKNKIAIYGTTWRDIPFNRYPDSCQGIANKKCKDINSGLSYNTEVENINSECATGCLERINIYREQKKTDTEAINQAVKDKKCSSFNVGNQCLQGAILINRTKNRCDECLSAQETCESKTDPIQKKSCIESHCNNYEGISTSITSPSDFYNKCSILQTKDFCYVCLKEYFMPAGYCGKVYDYINRGFVKYPALVYDMTWWGRHINFSSPKNDCTFPAEQYIPTGLTCRIMPDFIFPFTNGKGCKDFCTVTEEELKNIGDDKPGDSDCVGPSTAPGNPEWGGAWMSAGLHPGGQWLDYLIRKKAKCCAALLGHDPVKYKACRGIEEAVPKPGDGGEEATACKAGEVELAYIKTTMGGLLNCPDDSNCYQGKGATSNKCRRGCSSIQFKVPNMGNIDAVDVRTNPAPGGSIVTVATSGCTGGNNYVGREPTNSICQMEAKNTKGAESCCTNKPGNAPIGKDSMTCDLSKFVGRTLTLSVTSDDLSDCKTTAYICVPE